ncbi:hypothetical protein ACF3VQ_16665 [Yersinia sp. HM-2024]|uniref:hypothetical protein n=1 Tax=Yersinia TaxID=629 RepID=UPI0005E7AF8A|nr:hypothetical protein [Yersinia frederiksenii]CQI96493.1 transposase [Yersinia frederiksenii]
MKNILDAASLQENPDDSVHDEQWLSAQAFVGKPGMPGTAKGCRLRLEKLAAMHPEIRRKRTGHKGFEYHIRAAGMSLKSERAEQSAQPAVSPYGSDEQLNLWVQLFKTMKPHSRDRLLKQALEQVAEDIALAQPTLPSEVITLARQLLMFSEEQREELLEIVSRQ